MIETIDPHAEFKVTDPTTGKSQSVYNNEMPHHDYPFAFTVPFSDGPTPQTNTVTIYNMSKEHRAFYHRKQKAQLYFDWGKDNKLIAEGYITKIDHAAHDGVTDSQVIYFKEGTDYNNVKATKLRMSKKKKVNKYKTVKVKEKDKRVRKRRRITETKTYKEGKRKGQKYTVHHWQYYYVTQKGKTKNKRVKYRATKTIHVNRTFKKGTSHKKIIRGIVAQAGMKIAKLDLAKDKPIKKPFTAKGKPLTLLKQIVQACDSKMIYSKGKLEIINPKSAKRTWYTIDDKDLIQPPSYNESDSGGKGTYEIQTPLLPDVGPNTGIKMNSKYLKGKFYISAGQHSNDGENPTTQCSLVAL